jgi:hypothetical protein
MAVSVQEEMTAILQRVRAWPVVQQRQFAEQVLASARAELPPPGVRRVPAEQAAGILATTEPPPSDDEVRRIIGEERMRKYG